MGHGGLKPNPAVSVQEEGGTQDSVPVYQSADRQPFTFMHMGNLKSLFNLTTIGLDCEAGTCKLHTERHLAD